MKKVLLSVGVFAVVLLLAFIALVIFLPSLVDTQTFKDQLTEQVRERTGQELSVTGDLSISVFPWLGIRTGEIRLSQPPSVGLDQPLLLSVQRADVGVKFLPLLQKKIEISEIVFDSPSITYIETKNGSNSLDGFNPQQQAESEQPKEDAPASESSGGFQPAAIVIAGISITNGELTVDNQALGELHRVEDLHLSVGNLLGGELESLSFSAAITVHQQERISVEMESKAQLDLQSESFSLRQVTARVEQQSAHAELSVASLRADQNELEATDVTINADTADLLPAALKPEFSISRLSYDLVNAVSDNIAFSLIEKSLGLNATGDIVAQLADEALLYKGQLAIDELVPANLIDIFEIDYEAANKKALQTFALSSQFDGSDKGVSISDLVIQLDQTTMKGDIAITNFNKPRYNFAMGIDRINLDDYMPPATQESAKAEGENTNEALALLVPVEIFKAINANGNFTADLIQASGIKLKALNLAVASTDTTVTIQPTASLYEGTIGGAIKYKAHSAERSVVEIAPILSNVQFGDLLTDADITDQISGRGSLDIEIKVTDDNGQQTNQGTIGFLIKDGALKNIDIQKSLYEAQDRIDRIKGKTPPQRPATPSETRFAEASGTFALNNFLLSNNDLLVKAPAFRVNGKGTVNIEDQSMDYLANVAIVETSEGQGGKALNDLKGITVPVTIKGSFVEPNTSIDVKALIKANTQKDVDQEVDKKKEELLEDAKKKLLNKFFN